MAIVTISRERGAFGRSVAKALSASFGARFIDREIVDARLEAMGITAKNRHAFDERKPGFFAALTTAVEEYVCCLKQILYEEAMNGNCVILGRGSQVLFKDVPGVISVRLVAPPEVRYQKVAETENIDLREAKQIVDRTDRDRGGFNSYFFDTEWTSPLTYQLVINTEHLEPANIAALITNLANETITPAVKEQSKTVLKNMAKAQAVERQILHVNRIPVFFLKVMCDGTQATLTGVVHSSDVIEKARQAAMIDGIERIQCRLEIGLHGHFDAATSRRI